MFAQNTRTDSAALSRLADFFGVSVDYLLCWTEISIRSKSDLMDYIKDAQEKLEAIHVFLKE